MYCKIYFTKKARHSHLGKSKPTALAHNESAFQGVCLHRLLTYFFSNENKLIFF